MYHAPAHVAVTVRLLNLPSGNPAQHVLNVLERANNALATFVAI